MATNTPVIYVDFEGRIGKPPALLGTLKPDRRSDRFTQWVLDPALKSATVAAPQLVARSFDDVADWLAAALTRTGARLVAWSEHELRLFQSAADVSAGTRRVVQEHYVSAIPAAKAWRRTVLPDWTPPQEDLESYLDATGYHRKLSRRVVAKPAEWIRHVSDRVSKCGSYRAVGRTVKRDWHRLLTYNEDDCRGLRHVYEVTTRELSLWQAYLATRFLVDGPRGPVTIRIGQGGRRLRRLLEDTRARTWAFVTAFNPMSQQLSNTENANRHRALMHTVSTAGHRWLPARGVGEGNWPAEESLFIVNIRERRATALGRSFGQLAIVFGERGGRARLVSCRRRPA